MLIQRVNYSRGTRIVKRDDTLIVSYRCTQPRYTVLHLQILALHALDYRPETVGALRDYFILIHQHSQHPRVHEKERGGLRGEQAAEV